MEKRQILNIVNFVRGVEPRCYRDLLTPVKEQIRLMLHHRLRGTFLLQYDTLLDPDFTELFKNLDPAQFELGVWHEIVQPQVESCGIPWRGRYSWDWHTHCGFPVGYSRPDREKLVSALYERFKEVFGYYPRVFGSWFFDSHTLRYIADRYGADAFCNCKEQYGTDGYTLWGGYYGQGYYPAKTNVFFPAQSPENQISIPVFRMLGSDPVDQYDYQLDAQRQTLTPQGVITLEPGDPHKKGGADPAWVDWFMAENYNGECLSFGYAQAGQENSFSWELMKDGLVNQFALFEKLQASGKLSVEPLGETGRWYQAEYALTPPSVISAHSSFEGNKTSLWYSTRYYRINLYTKDGRLRIRDLHIFSDAHPDPYENNVCTENYAVYDALPVIDGNRNTGKGILAGAYPVFEDRTCPQVSEMTFEDTGGGTARVDYGGFSFELYETGFRLLSDRPFLLESPIGIPGDHLPEVEALSEREVRLRYKGTSYGVTVKQGRVREKCLCSTENAVELQVLTGTSCSEK